MKIIVGLTEHLGDIVACEPVTRYLKKQYPSASVAWVVSAPYRELIDANPYVDETIVVDCLTDWIKLTKHANYDRVVDLHINYRVCPHCRVPLFKTVGNPCVSAYDWFDYGSILEAFSFGAGLPKLSEQPQVYLQGHHRERVDQLDLGGEYCVIHRKSNDAAKDWRDADWQKLVEWLLTEKKLRVVEVSAGTDPGPLRVRHAAYRRLHNATTILETAEIIRRSRLFIGIDSGPAHLANAQFVPGVVLLGRYGYFRRYMPFSGHYAASVDDVKIVRNLTGQVKDIPLNEVVAAAEYVLRMPRISGSAATPASVLTAPVRKSATTAADARTVPAGPVDWQPAPDSYSHTTAEIALGKVSSAETDYPRVFSFYLPQFHPIAENNASHGMGFTEWQNVNKSKPLFKGHYQPRMPGELGMYDLRAIDVMREQVRLAMDHGLSGLCFYYYYFNGRKLLYTPIENYIRSDIEMPFFFLWANENWTERWDGGNKRVIIEQRHSREDDRAFLEELLPIFNDTRYVKVDGKPILMVYKAHLFPDIAQTTETWRRIVEDAGFPGIYLVMVDDWVPVNHPRDFGFDATYEIPSNITRDEVFVDNLEAYDLAEDFNGRLVDYQKFASFHSARISPWYKRFRTVMLPWDNTARYRNQAFVHVNTDNDAYKTWLTGAYIETYKKFAGNERVMFIHSWNEWCEGTYLEPDGRYGRRFLEQTRDAIRLGREVIDLSERLGQDTGPLLTMRRLELEREASAFRNARYSRDELDKLRGRLGEIYESTSWRLTRPLRQAKQATLLLVRLMRLLRRQ